MLTLNAQSFCWWLAGFVETNGGRAPTTFEWEVIVLRLKALSHAQTTSPTVTTVPWDPWTYELSITDTVTVCPSLTTTYFSADMSSLSGLLVNVC